jgi:manganese/zinc/iron transport system substrate-binding protein
MTGTRRRCRIAGAAALALLAQGCGGAARDAADDERLSVVATTGMIGDAAERIGSDRVRVISLMGPGVDPHLYKARAGDVRRLSRADLVLYNGLHLEAAMGEVLEELGQRQRTVAVSTGVDRWRLMSPPEFGGSFDPHIWFDVGLWSDAVRRIGQALAEADPEHAEEYTSRMAAYLDELAELDVWVRSRVATVPPARRVLITAHDAFGYFGRAYGFEVMGLQGISTTAEAGTSDVQRLAALIAARRIPAVFVETSVPRRTIEAVQAAVASRGFRVEIGGALYSDAMGDAGTPEGSYIGMVRHNVDTIVAGLGGLDEGR